MVLTIKHGTLTGAAANPKVLVDGPKWDADHQISGTLPADLLPFPPYNTVAAAQAATIPAGISTIQTLGQTTVNDGGGMTLEVLSSDPGAGQRFALSGGKYGRNIERVLRPEQFGMFPTSDGATVHQALVDMATELQRRGGGKIAFPDGKDYRWLDVNPVLGSTTLAMSLSGLRGVQINFNGSRLLSGANWSSQQAIGRLFQITDCIDVEIIAPRIEQDFITSITQNYGMSMLTLAGACKDVRVIAPRQMWGTEMLAVIRGGAYTALNRTEDILVDGGRAQGVSYPLNFRQNGDSVEVNRFRAVGCERCYFPYNVRNHRVQIESSAAASTADDCLIKVYAHNTDSVEENTTANIELFYATRGEADTAARNSYVDFAIQQYDTNAAAGTLRNITVQLDIGPTAFPPAYGVYTQKLDSTGTAEATVRNHIVNTIKITGKMTGDATHKLATTNVFALFDTTNGNFSGEYVDGIEIDNFVLQAANNVGNVAINLSPITSISMNNVTSSNPIVLTGGGPTTLRASNVKSPGYTSIASVSVVKKQAFTASGTYTPSTGMLYAILECVGGGGGGGGAAGSVSSAFSGGGGGSGGYSRAIVSAASVGASKAVTIGPGGAGGAAGANNGVAGTDTSVGALCVGKGGSGGLFGSAGQVGAGGLGGVAGTGDLIPLGNPGGFGIYVSGVTGTLLLATNFGASSALGAGAPAPVPSGGATVIGNAASANTGGGGSGGITPSASSIAGGNGGSGIAFITELCSQ